MLTLQKIQGCSTRRGFLLLTNLLLPAMLSLFYVGETQAEITVQGKPFAEVSYRPQQRAPATVLAVESSEISAEISARVEVVKVQVGDFVESGTVLLQLDCRDYELQLSKEKAQANSLDAKYQFAKYQLQRAQTLNSKQAVAEELLMQRKMDLAVLQAGMESQNILIAQAKRNVAKCDVKAPYAAVVSQRMGQVGETVNPGAPLLKLVNVNHTEVSAQVPSSLVEQFSVSTKPQFVVGEKRYPLLLRAIIPSIETRERTQEVRLSFTGKKPLPGTAGELEWVSPIPHLPAQYIVKRNDVYGLFVVENQHARFVEVKGAVAGRSAPTVLDDAQLVVTKGQFRLQDGDAVVLQ